MRKLNARHIPALETMTDEALFEALCNETEKHPVACVNWNEYPYCPQVEFHVAYSDTSLAILYRVKEDHVLGTVLEENGPVWEDSCVETFIGNPNGEGYYNVEITCIGTKLAARRQSRTEFQHFCHEKMEKIRCFGSLPHEAINSETEGQEWWIVEVIPFELFGLEKAPESLRMNFYKCGDNCRNVHFLSWSEIGHPTPNFHCPEYFGEVILTDSAE